MRFVHGMTYEQCGYHFNVTRERIRQVEAKAIRKLRNPRFRKNYLLDTLGKAFQIDAERFRLEKENERLIARLEAVGDAVQKPQKAPRHRFDISDMELSVRSYNCLKRAGYNYVDELDGLDYDKMTRIRNLGRKSIIEVMEKAKEFGIIIPMEGDA